MRGRMLDKIASRIGGYDIFISYRHSEATKAYATELERRLEAGGMMVFRDESEEEAGVPLEVFVKRACSARTLVVLAAPGIFGSENVRAELTGYLQRRMDRWYRRPFSRIVSINVDQTLSQSPPGRIEWSRLSDFVYVPETSEAVERGTPTPEVVERLSRAGSFMKSWQRFLVVSLLAATAIFSSAAGASVFLRSTVKKLSRAEASLADTRREAAALDASNSRLEGSSRALGEQNRGLRASADSLTREGEALGRENRTLLGRNGELAAQGDQLRRQTDALQRQASELRQTGRMLQFRIAAMNQLASDPLVAYRLAVEAYRLDPGPHNRELILASLSKLDLTYTRRSGGHSIEGVREPYVLLSASGGTAGGKTFSVFDMRTSDVRPAHVNGRRAWIVPFGAAWRIVGMSFVGSGSRAVPTYQLWDHEGRAMGEPAQGRTLAGPQFINGNTARIPLPGGTNVLLWDVVRNTRHVIHADTGESSASYFRRIYDALATRSDGSSAAHHDRGLILVDAAGRLKRESYTAVSFDPFRVVLGGQLVVGRQLPRPELLRPEAAGRVGSRRGLIRLA